MCIYVYICVCLNGKKSENELYTLLTNTKRDARTDPVC